jgi:hypothetical protein
LNKLLLAIQNTPTLESAPRRNEHVIRLLSPDEQQRYRQLIDKIQHRLCWNGLIQSLFITEAPLSLYANALGNLDNYKLSEIMYYIVRETNGVLVNKSF